jgi:hypothetical protein
MAPILACVPVQSASGNIQKPEAQKPDFYLTGCGTAKPEIGFLDHKEYKCE